MYSISTVGKIIAVISFMFGTILFSLFLYLGESYIPIMLGVKFVIVALFINTIFFFGNLILSVTNIENRIEFLKTCGIILLNIPVAILYFYIIISIEFPPKG
jgi:hypothetical protein